MASQESATGGTIYGGDDKITVTGDGNNVILGGLGADTITLNGNGSNVVLGDSGSATFDAVTTKLVKIVSTFASAPVGGTVDTGTSSNDAIVLGNGNNVVIGGAGADTITLGSTGSEVILGDDGEADFTAAGTLTAIKTTDDLYGGVDTIGGANGTFGGSGGSTVIGGLGGDTIKIGGAGNTILGDDGAATFDATSGKITSITTQDPTFGGNDTIIVSGGSNVIFGGTGADTINVQTVATAPSGNVILGDDGFAAFTTAGVLTSISSSDQTDGGDDVITTGDGNNTILGGSGADQIMVGAGANVIFGDNGAASWTPNLSGTASTLTQIATIGETAAASGGTMASQESATGGTIYGGDDKITVTGDGNNVILGGLGADTITLNGNGSNVVLGDSGSATFDAVTTKLVKIVSTFASAPVGGTADTGTSSNDAIVLGNGNNVVIGGAGADTITLGSTGSEVILGDDGEADFTAAGTLTKVTTTDDVYGAADTITGVSGGFGGSGGSTVIGGLGGDTIKIGGAGNTILGDDGAATFDATSGKITSITTQDPFFGGNDTIIVSGGSNVIFGGTGADTINVQTVATAPSGNVILGDDGFAAFTTAGVLTSISSSDQTDGGDDVITAGDGNNTILGGSGADQIMVGAGANVIFGDNGAASYTAGVLTQVATIAEITPTIGLVSSVETSDPTKGTIYGGDDVITTGNGNNVILGGLGADTIMLGVGNNVVLGRQRVGDVRCRDDEAGEDRLDLRECDCE